MAKNFDCWLFDVSKIVSTRCHASGFACSCFSTLSAAVLCDAAAQLVLLLTRPDHVRSNQKHKRSQLCWSAVTARPRVTVLQLLKQ